MYPRPKLVPVATTMSQNVMIKRIAPALAVSAVDGTSLNPYLCREDETGIGSHASWHQLGWCPSLGASVGGGGGGGIVGVVIVAQRNELAAGVGLGDGRGGT